MSYPNLIEYFKLYRKDKISKLELGCAIALWQRANNYDLKESKNA